jgi:hypothetical protein
MTAQLTPTRPEHQAPAGRYLRARKTAAIIASVAALIAVGGYVATTTIGPDAVPRTPATGADVIPSAQTQRELRESVAGQYGSHPTSDATVNPSAETRRELRDSMAGQYGHAR